MSKTACWWSLGRSRIRLIELEFRSRLLTQYPNSPNTQRQALLHLVHPDTFEGTVSIPQKNQIADARAFARFTSESTEDVDRKLYHIRRGLEAERNGKDFDFYDPDVRVLWDNGVANGGGGSDEVKKQSKDSPAYAANLAALADTVFLPTEFLREIETLLTEKKQVILQGPPGTGKTFVAQKLAAALAGSKDRVTLVQFHPSYAYEDFVQGYRPTLLDNGQPGFQLTDGPLLRAAEQARQNPDVNHFLIIDEINRGSVAKVFGELYFLLEYRDEPANLQYSDEPFSLPPNLYIIGTMNTADRSIALVDLALCAVRFYFVEFHPDDAASEGLYFVTGWSMKAPRRAWSGWRNVVERSKRDG